MNMVKVAEDMYLVRTQAEFKKAVKVFSGEVQLGDVPEVEGYPKSYPSVVSLSVGYKGYLFIQCNSVHVNVLKEVIHESEERGMP